MYTHPELETQNSRSPKGARKVNKKLCKEFKANSDPDKNVIRSYKSKYLKMTLEKRKELYQKLSPHTQKVQPKVKQVKPMVKQVKQSIDATLLPLPDQDPGIEKFSRWWSFPRYKGLFKWQKESHNILWDAPYGMELVHRDAGKSVKYSVEYQWAMLYKGYDVLLLGWTARRKEIAAFVFAFFKQYNLIDFDKRTSPFHFKIKNGGKFDCYLITGKEVLGMHSLGKQERFMDLTEKERKELKAILEMGKEDENKVLTDEELDKFIAARQESPRKLWISIDDPIDISFMRESHREEELEIRFDSTLYSINPDKWSFTGTHKFEGDIFDFWRNKFKKKLVIYKRGPINPDGSLLCPEKFTYKGLGPYQADIKAGKRDLDEVRQHIGEYAWHSDWCQNPHPITGEEWDGIEEEIMLIDPKHIHYNLLWLTIDRATTTKSTSDYTGCVIGVREIATGNRIIIDDFTGIITFNDLLILINHYISHWRAQYPKMPIVLIIERQGGGDDFITMAKNLPEFAEKKLVNGETQIVRHINKIPEIAAIEPVWNSAKPGDKLSRIKERLVAPIKNGKLRILRRLRKSEIWNNIMSFPNNPKMDAIDAVANSEHYMLANQVVSPDYLEQVAEIYRSHAKDKDLLPYEDMKQLTTMEYYNLNRHKDDHKHIRRTVFKR